MLLSALKLGKHISSYDDDAKLIQKVQDSILVFHYGMRNAAKLFSIALNTVEVGLGEQAKLFVN